MADKEDRSPSPVSSLSLVSLEGLLERHNTLVCRLNELRQLAIECLGRIKHVEGTISILDPTLSLEAIDGGTLPYVGMFRHGEITAVVLEILQHAECPMCTVEIGDAILERRGFPNLKGRDRKRLLKAVSGVLGQYLRRGVVMRLERMRRLGMGSAGSVTWTCTQIPLKPMHVSHREKDYFNDRGNDQHPD